MKRISLTVYFLSVLLFSCSNSEQKKSEEEESETSSSGVNNIKNTSELSAAEYIQWMKNADNGFRNEKMIDDLIFSVQYKTSEFIACIEQHGQTLDDSTLINKKKELDGMQYYDLKITVSEGQGELLKYKLATSQQYNERLNYFAFGMEKDIRLVDGNDTLSCGLYHFERAYDVSPSAIVLLGFPKKQNDLTNDKTIIVYDKTFNKGTLKFKFKAKELNNKPKLKTL